MLQPELRPFLHTVLKFESIATVPKEEKLAKIWYQSGIRRTKKRRRRM